MLPLILIAILETGWIPFGDVANYLPMKEATFANSFYIKLGITASWRGFYLDGSAKILAAKSTTTYAFQPTSLWSSFGAGWKNDVFAFGWRHECDHPIAAWYIDRTGTFMWDAGWDEMFLRVTIRSK